LAEQAEAYVFSEPLWLRGDLRERDKLFKQGRSYLGRAGHLLSREEWDLAEPAWHNHPL